MDVNLRRRVPALVLVCALLAPVSWAAGDAAPSAWSRLGAVIARLFAGISHAADAAGASREQTMYYEPDSADAQSPAEANKTDPGGSQALGHDTYEVVDPAGCGYSALTHEADPDG